MKIHDEKEVKEIGLLLLEIGSLLMSTGASTARIRIIVSRIADAFGYTIDLFITHRALTLTLNDENEENLFHGLKRTSPHGVNFRIVSGISRMSWRVVEERWSLEQIRVEIDRLVALPHYPRLLILALVALAGSAFCRLAGGNAVEMLITYLATFCGLFIRQEAHKRQFNLYLCVFFGAATASLISGGVARIGLNIPVEHAFATSVLFLIPGVPFINTFTDLFDGNTLNGILRWTHGLILAFMIALGMLFAIFIYQI